MPVSGESAYSYDLSLPDILQAGRPNTVSLTVRHQGSIVVPSSATFTLYPNGDQTAVIDAAVASISAAGVVSYTIPAAVLDASLSGRDYGAGWMETWHITIDGVEIPRNRPAAMSIRPIEPTVSDADLLAEHPDIIAYAVNGTTTLQTVRDAAWGDIVRRWLQAGGSTWNIGDSGLFHESHRELTFAKFWLNTAKSNGNETLVELATQHRKAYESAWNRIVAQYDRDQDGRLDDPNAIEAGPVIMHRGSTIPTTIRRPWGRYRRPVIL